MVEAVHHALHQRNMWARLVADALVDGDAVQLADYVERYVAARREANDVVASADRTYQTPDGCLSSATE